MTIHLRANTRTHHPGLKTDIPQITALAPSIVGAILLETGEWYMTHHKILKALENEGVTYEDDETALLFLERRLRAGIAQWAKRHGVRVSFARKERHGPYMGWKIQLVLDK
jgi:hypothetical protein